MAQSIGGLVGFNGVLDPSDRGFPCLKPPGGEKQPITLQHLQSDLLLACDV